jgi:hypothetical protein
MHKMEELKEMLVAELEKLTKKGELSAGSLDAVDKLTHSIKSIDTIMAMEGYSSEDYSRTGMSYARRRDSRGRYADSRYSRDDIADHLRDMERNAHDEESRQMIRRWMKQVED